jgi:hypothetical protein
VKKVYSSNISKPKNNFMQPTSDQIKKQVNEAPQTATTNNPKLASNPLNHQSNRQIPQANIKIHNNPSGAKPSIYRRNSPNQ